MMLFMVPSPVTIYIVRGSILVQVVLCLPSMGGGHRATGGASQHFARSLEQASKPSKLLQSTGLRHPSYYILCTM
jgi:hypothetical protein